jgi:hypothetical protein
MMTMTTPSGTICTMSPSWLFPYMPFQRPINMKHVLKLVRNWKWPQASILTVHAWNPHITKYLSKTQIRQLDFDPENAYHVSNGDHRLEAVKILFGPKFVFTEEHAKKGLIPKGDFVNSPVLLTCQISDDDPVDTFIDQNAGLKASAAYKFLIRMHRGDEPENSLYAALTRRFQLAVIFDSTPVGDRRNTTVSGHALIHDWTTNRGRVLDALDIVTTIYVDNKVIDPTALSEGFMKGIIDTLTTCQRLHYDTTSVRKALTRCKAKGWSAFTITRFCQSNGTRGISGKTKTLLLYLVTQCIKMGKVPDPNDVNLLDITSKEV